MIIAFKKVDARNIRVESFARAEDVPADYTVSTPRELHRMFGMPHQSVGEMNRRFRQINRQRQKAAHGEARRLCRPFSKLK